MKNIITTLTIIFIITSTVSSKMFIGEIKASDLSKEDQRILNKIFVDVWTENCPFKIIKNAPDSDYSEFCETLQMVEDDKFVTGEVIRINDQNHLRIDVYNHRGVREHVARVILGSSATYTETMLTEREHYYSPTTNQSIISSSGKHHFGWGLNVGSGIKPTGFQYTIKTTAGLDSTIAPANLAITDLMITDLIGTNRDVMLSAWLHYNWRAAIGIGMGVKKMFLKRHSFSPTVGLDVGLNKQIIQKVMGNEETNYVGSRDGLMVQAKAGMVFLRDMKRNVYFDVAYTKILSEKDASYPSVQFGIITTWKHKKDENK